jgi:hypothetical protein
MPVDSVHKMVGVIVEILTGYGLAHVMTDDKKLLGVRRATPGVRFDELQVGDVVELEVGESCARVERARVLRAAMTP